MPDSLSSLLVKLTSARDMDSLEKLLLAAFKQLFQAERVELISLHQLHQEQNLPPGQLYALADNGKHVGCALILGANQPTPCRKSLQALTKVFINQSYHISRGCHDRLTGLLNRRQLDEFMEHIFCDSLHQQRRKKLPIRCIALLDIDPFKAINDNYGHLFGDEVLINIANQMRYCFRQEDGLYRYGGEEFVVVLEYVSAEEAHVILDRFRQHIESFDFPKKIKVTISIGYVELDYLLGFTPNMEHIDQALYYVKNHGRNNIANYASLLEQGKLLPDERQSDDVELF